MNEQIKQRIAQLNNGEVPNGYEKTEFGIFPCDWIKDKTFGDLFDFYGGLGKSRDELGDEGHVYLHYGDLHRGAFNVVSHEQYAQLPKYDVALKGTETYLMEDGDVAFLDASEDLEGTSRAVLIDNPDNEPFIAGLHIIYGKSKDESLEKWYKQYITSSASVRKQFQRLAAGFKVYGVNRDTLPKIQVAYPKSAEEQSKIAEILMKWDEAIELQEEFIHTLEIKRMAILQSFFSKEKCSNWIKLSDYVKEVSNRNNIGCQNVKSVSNKNGFIDQSSQFSKQVASEDVSKYKVVTEGCVAYNPSRINVGSIAIYNEDTPGIVSPMYVVFKCVNMDPRFLLLLLETARGKYEVKSYLSGSVRDSLAFEDLKSIEIAVPPKGKWGEIVDIFNIIDAQYKLYNDKLYFLRRQRKVLQQYLLNGIVRV